MPCPNPWRWLVSEHHVSTLHRIVRFLLLFELALLVTWVSLFIVLATAYPAAGSPDLWYAKLGMVISLLGHPGTALVLIKLDHELDKGRAKRAGWGRFFWLFGNLFTDVWSVVDAWSDLADRAIAHGAVAVVQAFTTVALVASSVGVVVYFAVLMTQSSSSAENEDSAQLVESLLPAPKVQPLRARRGM